MTKFGPAEQVYVENERYDGPRAGVAAIAGVPHRFKSMYDDDEDNFPGTFLVWPVTQENFDLEVEQWRIFVDWNTNYELGLTHVDTHPGQGGIDVRWDELEVALHTQRSNPSALARTVKAKLTSIHRTPRYASTGPSYALSWEQ